MRRDSLNRGILFLILVIGSILLPVIFPKPHYKHILIMVCIGSISAISWRFVYNMGQTNFGPAAFIGIGAYSSTLLVMNLKMSFWVSLPLSGIISGIIAVLIGYPTLRLRGLYFAITTFAFQEVLRSIWLRFKTPFGGPQGIYNIPLPNDISLGFGKIAFKSLEAYYYLVLAVLIFCVFIFYRVDRTRFGMTLRAIREADNLAECVGVNLMIYQVTGWAIACFFTGLSGSLYAHYIRFIDPYSFSMFLSVDIIAYTIVGGMDFAWGPIIGALILVTLSEILHASGGHYSALFIGISLIAFVILLRGGITGLMTGIRKWLVKTGGEGT